MTPNDSLNMGFLFSDRRILDDSMRFRSLSMSTRLMP